METRRIRLREVQEKDIPTLFKWRNTKSFRYLFHYNESTVNYSQFREEFARDELEKKFHFVIEKIETNELIGVTFVFNFSEVDKYCFLNLFLAKGFERKGYGVDVFILFGRFLFESIKIKNIYTQAFAYNTFSIACMRRLGMTQLPFSKKKIHNKKEYDIVRFVGNSSMLEKLATVEKRLYNQ